MQVAGNVAFPALVFTNHLHLPPSSRGWEKWGCSQYCWSRLLSIISLLNFPLYGNRFPDDPTAWRVLINSSEIFLSFLTARKCHSQAEDAVAWSLCHSLEFSSLPKIRQIIYQQAWFSDDLYSQQPGCTLRNNSFHPALEGLYSYWKNEQLPGKFSSVLPFIPTTWWYLQTYHFYPAAQKLNIQEQGKASAGSSSFTSVSIISSAFLASHQNPYFPLECSTFVARQMQFVEEI